LPAENGDQPRERAGLLEQAGFLEQLPFPARRVVAAGVGEDGRDADAQEIRQRIVLSRQPCLR
jgi:hypothetical protein